MHSCLTLVDYTWKDGDDSGTQSPNRLSKNTVCRLRRSARSLDGESLDNSLHQHSARTLNRRVSVQTPGATSSQSSLGQDSSNSTDRPLRDASQVRHSSMLLLTGRRPPIYAATRRLLRAPDKVWVPVGHCRYLLERDLRTGEIKWSPETNELICSPRNLAEMCMARLIRDWPCMLPPRRSSLRNMVSFLFSSREIQATTSQTNRPSGSSSRRSMSLSTDQTRATVCKNEKSKASGGHVSRIQEETVHPNGPLTCHDLPINLLISLIHEAILQRDCAAISGLVANWPSEQLVVRQLIPIEEFPLSPCYLTKPTFVLVSPETEHGNRNTLVKGPSLLDAFILGLLARQPACKLKSVDFTGFEEDRRVSIELSRLPILWMKPENRKSESVRRHLMASLHIGIPKKRLEAYFARISTIYAFHEAEIGHGEPFETVTIHLDCNMTVDEVALGLSLQTLTPFRFSCNRLLLQRLPEINFPPYSLIRLFDPLAITQFELEDPALGSSLAVVLPSAVGWLISLRNLRACSLPSCIPPPPEFVTVPTHSSAFNSANLPGSLGSNSTTANPTAPVFSSSMAACRLLNRALVSLRYLQRLGLARCHLTGQLKVLLGGLSQPLEYLNLQDCSLSAEDIHFLVYQWRPLHGLYELNLSRNNLSVVSDATLDQLIQNVCLKPQGRLVCLSIAYTCLSTERLIWFLGLMAGTDMMHNVRETNNDHGEDDETHSVASDKWMDIACTLRVLCIQSFIPPARDQIHRILHRVMRLPKLHRLHLLPASYAFPASTEINQRELRLEQLMHCRNYLRQRGRPEIEVL